MQEVKFLKVVSSTRIIVLTKYRAGGKSCNFSLTTIDGIVGNIGTIGRIAANTGTIGQIVGHIGDYRADSGGYRDYRADSRQISGLSGG